MLVLLLIRLVPFVFFFMSVVVGGDDEAATPVRYQGNFGIARLDPVNFAVPFAVAVEVVSLMVVLCLAGSEEARAEVGEGQVRRLASNRTMVSVL